jgi:hypothetical protein
VNIAKREKCSHGGAADLQFAFFRSQLIIFNFPVLNASMPGVNFGARIPVKLHRRVCLVQTEDAVLAEEILARKKLTPDIVGRLTERILLVRPGRADAVIQELQRMGHTPRVVSSS